MRLFQTDHGIASADDDGLAILDLPHGTVVELLNDRDADPAKAAVRKRLPIADCTITAPVPASTRIFLIGANYRSHIEEAGLTEPSRAMGMPIPATALAGPYDAVALPAEAPTQVDYEGELAVLVGTPGRDIAPGSGWDHVAGLCVADDISARDVQHAGFEDGRIVDLDAVLRGKSFPGFKPLGPCVTTVEEIRAAGALTLRTRVNGQLRQEGTTAEMLFDFGAVVEGLSKDFDLMAGDVILTGTPSGVGVVDGRFLRAGDVVEVEVDHIGTLRNEIVAS
ncbi:fumarylacetoacetate hydrolase family protein [Amycolatopsis ultiminotia]|uniref:Fumarylacetoacetate hydrolase family protein n=1 Tax=Amycolatopsis ultiminotia TaxID=543629 RepID=A0ABP6V1T3_9PSEU